MVDRSLRFDVLERSFLWRDIGWLHLRLVPQPTGTGWQLTASSDSGPWTGAFTTQAFATWTEGAVWMALLPQETARGILCAHPPFAQALAALETPHAHHA
jgi:hypothetical protein